MRILCSAGAVLAAAALLAACGEGNDPSATSSPDSSDPASVSGTESTPPTGPVIPDGTWERTVTQLDAKAIGLPADVSAQLLGDDRKMAVAFRIEGAAYTHLVEEAGAIVPGDVGTAEYDDQDRWVITSDSAGCPGCVAIYEWAVTGDTLSLTLVDHDSDEDPVDLLIARLVTEGEFTRQP